MSSVYSSGNEVAAKAAIEAQVRTSFLKEDTDGSQYIDRQGLVNWLRSQFDSIAATDAVVNATTTDSLARAIDATLLVEPLAKVVGKENWSRTAAWPIKGAAASGDPAASMAVKLNELRAASQRISDYFAWLLQPDRLLTSCRELLGNTGLTLPDVKERRVESRVYQQTFVSDWEEESQPSDPSDLIDLDQDDSATVVLAQPPTGRNVAKWRLYRSNSGNSGAAFQFAAEGPVGQTTYVDSIKAADLDEVCPTTTWAEPRPDMRGLIGLPNGGMAGHVGNTVCFAESYKGYAWPREYEVTVESPIVGLGVLGQTTFVGTQGRPYFIGGADPASMSASKKSFNQSCVAARSIVSIEGDEQGMGDGVLWASPDGYCLASNGGLSLATEKLFTKEDWQRLNPASIFAAVHEQSLYFWWQTGTTRGCYSLHLKTLKLMPLDLPASSVFVELGTDTMYVTDGTTVKAVFGGGARRSAAWKGKLAQFLGTTSFAWLQVDGDFTAPVTVNLYDGNTLMQTKTVTSIEPVRIKARRFLELQVEVVSQSRITRVRLASDTEQFKAT